MQSQTNKVRVRERETETHRERNYNKRTREGDRYFARQRDSNMARGRSKLFDDRRFLTIFVQFTDVPALILSLTFLQSLLSTALQNSSACYFQRSLMGENMKWNHITLKNKSFITVRGAYLKPLQYHQQNTRMVKH